MDYSAIEARVVAWLAGEEWALEAFRVGRDIYVETAERMGGMTRFQGKVAVLALGYNGGTGSLAAMGAEGSEQELQMLVDQWRAANPSIVKLWKTMDRVFRTGGTVGSYLTVEKDGSSRRVRLPSGRAISYHNVRVGQSDGIRPGRMQFTDAKGTRVDTYGGRLIENATQAVARDILAEALIRLQEQGVQVVGHVHDEVIIQGVGDTSVRAMKSLMTVPPLWADGLPVAGEGFTCTRYRKG